MSHKHLRNISISRSSSGKTNTEGRTYFQHQYWKRSNFQLGLPYGSPELKHQILVENSLQTLWPLSSCSLCVEFSHNCVE